MFHASCDFVVSRYPHLMTDRPRVDVVVPFIGSDDALITLCAHLRDLRRRADDTVYVVDNRPEAGIEVGDVSGGLRIVRAPERQTSYHARNKGVAAGNAPWLVFVDADVRVPPDLIDRYFEPEPQKRTGILAGEIHDEPSTHRGEESISIRYAHLARVFAQEAALDNDRYSYAMTANCAIRRDAFEAVGGFVEHIRSGGDADICIRIQQSGWAMERRFGAVSPTSTATRSESFCVSPRGMALVPHGLSEPIPGSPGQVEFQALGEAGESCGRPNVACAAIVMQHLSPLLTARVRSHLTSAGTSQTRSQ